METDSELIKYIKDKSSRSDYACGELYKRHSQMIYIVFCSKGFDHEDAEDAMQKVFVKFLKSISQFKEKSSLKTYLYSIAKNLYIDIIKSADNRKLRTFDQIESLIEKQNYDDKTPESDLIREETRSCVRRVIREFAKENSLCADIITLIVLEKLDIKEVASLTGKSYGATCQYLSQCRKKISPLLQSCK